jgi:hypothetical protein
MAARYFQDVPKWTRTIPELPQNGFSQQQICHELLPNLAGSKSGLQLLQTAVDCKLLIAAMLRPKPQNQCEAKKTPACHPATSFGSSHAETTLSARTSAHVCHTYRCRHGAILYVKNDLVAT